jgi:hypothetical protein
MKNVPSKKRSQENWVKTALRLPPDLHRELSEASDAEIRSINAEIVVRLRQTPGLLTALENLSKRQDEMNETLQKILERLPPTQ